MRIRVLSYNIHRAIGVDRRFRPERIARVLEHYRPDVALLQEVDDGAPRSRYLDLARELADAGDFEHRAVGHNVTLRKGRYGNATLSLHPILRRRNIDLTIGRKKRRGCQHTSIRLQKNGASVDIELFNLHLGLSALERDRQMGLLVRSEEFQAIEESTPCFVGGDFNDWRGRLRPMFTEILGFGCATATRAGGYRDLKTYPSFSPTGSLDKIFFRGRVRLVRSRRCLLAMSRIASDHLPILADFHLEAAPAP